MEPAGWKTKMKVFKSFVGESQYSTKALKVNLYLLVPDPDDENKDGFTFHKGAEYVQTSSALCCIQFELFYSCIMQCGYLAQRP